MRRTNIVLLALAQLCAAKQPGFSIHEDLLAHPQFEVVFSESYILEKDAQLLLEGPDQPKPSAIPDANADADAKANTISSTGNTKAVPSHDSLNDFATADDGSEQISETFELINMPPLQYLCSVPVLAPPPGAPNQTATDLARAAEARELARASDRGTDIINTLESECMYYAAGWWSYSFCYGQEIVQFHAVQGKNGKAMKDPHSMEYVLGRMKSRQERDTAMEAEEGSASDKDMDKDKGYKDMRTSDVDVQKPIRSSSDDVPKKKKKLDVHKTELQVKGDQKYMVQRLGGGTVCDLTGRDRTMEIQYHCNQGASSDRISWIKEVTTCAYLMEVRTPRLCEEPAFLPPKPKHAHPISCRLVVHSDDELAQWHEQKTIEAREAMASKDQQQPTEDSHEHSETAGSEGLLIGGVVVGARQIFAEEVQHAAGAVPKLQNTKTAKAAAKAFKKSHPGGDKTREALQKAAAAKNEGGKFVRVLARGLGNDDVGNAGAVEVVDTAELQMLGVNVGAINELVIKMGALAGGKRWHVTAYDVGEDSLVLRAYIDTDEGEEVIEGGGSSEEATEPADKGSSEDAKDKRPTIKVVVKKVDADGAPIYDEGSDEDSSEGSQGDQGSEGSEETFKKDEL
ncbi:glucosidase ii beta subunit-like protein [Ophiostoma piceae UAMH 11346]|uniref:Endoplasmic reticulum lectin n=1 Tax=Ophiostoma piceae (strain UAMH 11346) TaxID=1262450 RepID=S3C9Y5_OPHP1|nr:glucosidase ii beta subunit-like protein [Ophiostoma piceae UAMH 11346]